MGTGYHGGFGATKGSKPIPASVVLVQPGEGEALKKAAPLIKPKAGYTDVIIHGDVDTEMVSVFHNGQWQSLDQRTLATYIRHSSGYKKGPIRLISCSMGSFVFSQDLANKLGVKVLAPSDTVWIHPSGRLTIGKTAFVNTGSWIEYSPRKRGKK